MKIFSRILLTTGLLLFGFSLVLVSIFRDQANTAKIPAMPNQSIYFLEVIQDRLTQWFTFDKNQKLNLWLEFADSRWVTASQLLENKKEGAALLTARKALGYQVKALDLLESMSSTQIEANKGKVEEAINRGQRLLNDWQSSGKVLNSAELDALKQLSKTNLVRLTNLDRK